MFIHDSERIPKLQAEGRSQASHHSAATPEKVCHKDPEHVPKLGCEGGGGAHPKVQNVPDHELEDAR